MATNPVVRTSKCVDFVFWGELGVAGLVYTAFLPYVLTCGCSITLPIDFVLTSAIRLSLGVEVIWEFQELKTTQSNPPLGVED